MMTRKSACAAVPVLAALAVMVNDPAIDRTRRIEVSEPSAARNVAMIMLLAVTSELVTTTVDAPAAKATRPRALLFVTLPGVAVLFVKNVARLVADTAARVVAPATVSAPPIEAAPATVAVGRFAPANVAIAAALALRGWPFVVL